MITCNETIIDIASIKSIRLNQINQLIRLIPSSIKYISLDCFDTILYRYLHEPFDVFYHLNDALPDHLIKIDPSARIQAEKRRYHYNYAHRGSNQCTLHEIYQTLFPDYNIDIINEYVKNEIDTELKYSYIPETIIQFIDQLSNQFKIIITSDIYFSKEQLHSILAHHLSPQMMNKITLISTSCDYQRSKSEDLFPILLTKLRIKPAQLLHIGDNYLSDYATPLQYGINAIRLTHASDDIKSIIRMLPFSTAFTDQAIRHTRGLSNIYAEHIYNSTAESTNPSESIGYTTLGPIMYSFSLYLMNEIDRIKNKHPNAKLVFLLRDAYLPYQCFNLIQPHSNSHLVRISRFSAFAASFDSPESIFDYLANKISPENFDTICMQLLLPENIKSIIIQQARNASNPASKFQQLLCQNKILKIIMDKSKEYKLRLYRYLKNTINLSHNDHLVFIDLGYSGTAQHRLKDILYHDYTATIEGLYLISLNTPPYEKNRTGLLNSNEYHSNTLSMLVTYIATLEQLCTAPDASVIDFDENGLPILSDLSIPDNQVKILTDIQQHVYRFIKDVATNNRLKNFTNKTQQLRDDCIINLCRLIYFPTKAESDLLSVFSHDINMGSSDTVKLIDVESNLDSLIRRGYLHSLKNSTTTSRMNYPAEWRYISLQLSINLLAQHRHDFSMTLSDLSHQSVQMNVFIDIKGQQSIIAINAEPTHNGYYSLHFPVSSQQKSGILIGESMRCFELYSAHLVEAKYLYTKNEDVYSSKVQTELGLFKINKIEDTLFNCIDQEGMIVFNAGEIKNMSILKVILRPIIKNHSSNELV